MQELELLAPCSPVAWLKGSTLRNLGAWECDVNETVSVTSGVEVTRVLPVEHHSPEPVFISVTWKVKMEDSLGMMNPRPVATDHRLPIAGVKKRSAAKAAINIDAAISAARCCFRFTGRVASRLTTPSSATAERGAVAAKVERRRRQGTWNNATTGRDGFEPE